jgi:tRNA(Ile)-lysidine synthase
VTTRRSSLVAGLESALDTHGLLGGHNHVLLAVSGGADSVALLLAMNGLKRSRGFKITVAHLDHRLRGAEGRGDAEFVEALARRLRVPCVTGRSDVRRLATRKRISIEMAAREARYRFLARTARDCGATAIATAHTADDQAETVLLRLARGSGMSGLAAIRWRGRVSDLGIGIPASEIELIRPLLDISRTGIESFLRGQGQAWRTDASNAAPAFHRNRVRHELLPLLETRLNPSIRTVLRRTAEIVGEEDAWLDEMAAGLVAECVDGGGQLAREALIAWPPALVRRAVRVWLVQCGVPAGVVDYAAVERVRALAGQARGTRSVSLKGPWRVVRRYGRLAVEPSRPACPTFRVALNLPGETLLPEQGLRVVIVRGEGVVREAGHTPGQLPASASLSRQAVGRRRLYLRSVQAGDRMQPYGMRGSRKLQDVLVDAKVPADQRGAIPILECGGQIAWLPGYRIAHPFHVTGEGSAPLQVNVERL